MDQRKFSFWRKKIAEARCVFDLFNICEELILDLKIKIMADDLIPDIVHLTEKQSSDHAELFKKIGGRLPEFGAQNIRYMDWYHGHPEG